MQRKLTGTFNKARTRLQDAYKILFCGHYFLFSTSREVDLLKPGSYYDLSWIELRREDAHQIGMKCFELIDEDDECASLLDVAKEILT